MPERSAFLYTEALSFLASFEQSTIKLGLQRIQHLLNALGHPQQHFRSVHVAGTNGKGSVAAMLDSLLASDNRIIGRFCSPHLITPRERILVDSRPMTRQWFSASLSYLRDVIEDRGLKVSYFELLTALSFYVFNFMKVDMAVVETGLGGRLDATNVLIPDLTVLTSISLDHTGMLGESVPAIALEKAGIIKPGVPVVLLNNTEAFPWIVNAAKKMSAPVVKVTPEIINGGCDQFSTVQVKIKEKTISATSPLRGNFQGENLALALASFHTLTGKTGDVSHRLATVKWPGRMEILPTSPPILLDGAHNPAGMEKFLENVGSEFEDGILIFGCMRDKNGERMYQMLQKRFKNIVLTSGNYHRFMDENSFRDCSVFDSPYLQLVKIIENIHKYQSVAVTGSLHLIGDFLKTLAMDHTYREVLLEMEPYCDIFDSDSP